MGEKRLGILSPKVVSRQFLLYFVMHRFPVPYLCDEGVKRKQLEGKGEDHRGGSTPREHSRHTRCETANPQGHREGHDRRRACVFDVPKAKVMVHVGDKVNNEDGKDTAVAEGLRTVDKIHSCEMEIRKGRLGKISILRERERKKPDLFFFFGANGTFD